MLRHGLEMSLVPHLFGVYTALDSILSTGVRSQDGPDTNSLVVSQEEPAVG